MSGKFNGFSQEDINKLTSKSTFRENVMRPISRPRNTVIKVSDKKTMPTVTPSIVGESDTSLDSSIHPLEEAVHFKPLPSKTFPPTSATENNSINDSDISIENIKNNNCIENEPGENLSPFKGISLKDFESQRKLIQEQNKAKKELLVKAIEQHSERTAAEAKKLQEVKKELNKLDTELAADVAILRKQIESASFQYMNIQKHYQQMETMFLKAKLDLHQASEKKELLTEHLCTIIAHNEERKAKRLSELMAKVGLTINEEEEVDNKA